MFDTLMLILNNNITSRNLNGKRKAGKWRRIHVMLINARGSADLPCCLQMKLVKSLKSESGSRSQDPQHSYIVSPANIPQ